MFYIYGILNCINGKFYIGKTNELKKIWIAHLRVARGGKEKYPRMYSIIHQAMNKYGFDNFECIKMQEFSTEKYCYLSEKYWIDFYQSRDRNFGYNISPGGIGSGSGRNSVNFGLKRSPETLLKMTKSHIGNLNQNYNKKFSEETKIRMSRSQKGNQVGEQHPRSILTWEIIDKIRSLSNKVLVQLNYLKCLIQTKVIFIRL